MHDEDCVVGAIAFFAGVFIGALSCGLWRDSVSKQTAIDHGAAVWSIDPKTGETEFKWLTPTTAKGE